VLRHDLADALTPPPGDQTTPWPARGCSHRPKKPLSAVVAGFSLHAARTVDEDDRAGLERLCRYGLRSLFSQERLSLLPDGRVVYLRLSTIYHPKITGPSPEAATVVGG